MKIAALDFETANNMRGSVCAVGVVTFSEGEEHECFSSLIRPHQDIYPGFWDFEHIHGITSADVWDAPEFPEVSDQVLSLLTEADLVVCHNAGFDISQLRYVMDMYHLPKPNFSYACTYRAAQRLIPDSPNYKLNTLANRLNISFKHHDALDDARAAGRLMLHLLGENNLTDWAKENKISIKTFPGR